MKPGQDRALQVQAAVLRVMQDGGSDQRALAYFVQSTVLPRASLDTCRRRLKEAVSALVLQGHPVCSDAKGYRLATTDAERDAGRRFLTAQIRSLAARLRAFDRATADRLQLVLGLDA